MEKMTICQVCGEGHLQTGSTTNQIDSDMGKLEVERHFHWCDACGTEQTLSKDSKANAIAAKNARRNAVRLSPAQIFEVIYRVGMTQEAAGTILGGGSVAFSKYKHGAVLPAEAMDNLLWCIQQHPFLAGELAARHGLPDAVSIDVKCEEAVVGDLVGWHNTLDTSSLNIQCSLNNEHGPDEPINLIIESKLKALDEESSRETSKALIHHGGRGPTATTDATNYWQASAGLINQKTCVELALAA